MTNLGVTPPIVLPLRLPSLADANVTLSTSCLLFAVYGVLHFTGWILPKQQLSKQERGEWNVRAVSTVNALVISLGGVLSVADTWRLTPRQCFDDFGPLPLFFCQLFLGYLLFDLLLELCAGAPVLRNPSAVVHHLIFLFLNSYLLAYQILPFTFACSLLGELSTPCLNLRWCLAVTKREKTTAYLLNGAALALLFFIFRIVVYGAGLAHLWGLRVLPQHLLDGSHPQGHPQSIWAQVKAWMRRTG